MKAKGTLVCITCPIGCRLTTETLPDGKLSVSGNLCPRGAAYAEAEILDPRRVVTATCRTNSAEHPRLPVRTDSPCPKDRIDELLEKIYRLEVKLPVKAGQVLIDDFAGVKVLASRSFGKSAMRRKKGVKP
jgi:CxxC motif-containing protein